MLVVIPFCQREKEMAFRLLRWIADMGNVSDHDILIQVPSSVSAETAEQAMEIIRPVFNSATLYHLIDDCAGLPFPFPHNFTWRRAIDYIEHFKLWPFFFMEPDAIPLSPDWLNKLEDEYERQGKPFMGYLEFAGQDKQHMNGVGVYGDLRRYAPLAWSAPTPVELSQVGRNAISFDMASAPDVVPNMHVTKLIQFRYQEEGELLKDESLSWLKPEAVIFHTEKTGKLIELLRQRGGEGAAAPVVPTSPISPASAKIGHAPTVDIFIKSYPADAMWLQKCVDSINRFCTGFRNVQLALPVGMALPHSDTAQVISGAFDYPLEGPGYLEQQVHKLKADHYTGADYILTTDSDTLFTVPVTPETYFRNWKPTWFFASREIVLAVDPGTAKWFRVMKEAIGVEPQHEFMRRQPFLVPRWLLQAFRLFMCQRHGKSVAEYVMAQDEFSEWNVLGFYAYTFHREAFDWIDTESVACPPVTVRQFWSAHHWTPERRLAQFNEALPEMNRILGAADRPALPPSPAAVQRLPVVSDGWETITAPKPTMGLIEKVVAGETAEAAKKRANQERMAKVRAARKPREVA